MQNGSFFPQKALFIHFSYQYRTFSSPRAESTWAVTGRRCLHSGGVGEDFLVRRPGPLTKMDVTRERKVVDKIRGCQNLANDQA